MPAIFLTHASQLLTLRGGDGGPRRGPQMSELAIVEDGAVLIENDKIVAVGTTDKIAKHELARKADEIDCSGKVVLPGFVDSHTHPVFTTPRLIDFERRIAGASYEEIAAAGGGIRASLRGVRESSQEALAAHVLRALDEMAAQGTTTVEAKSGYGLSFEAEIKSLEAIREVSEQWSGTVVATLLAAHVFPPEYRENHDEYVRLICDEMIPAVSKRRLAKFVDVFCERGAFNLQRSERILRAAVNQGLGVRAHVCQLTLTNLAPLIRLRPASLDHMDFVSEDDISALATVDTVATLLPAANYFLGLRSFPPARKLIDFGVAVALATDYNPGTAPTPSMPFVLSAACTHMKMSPAEAIMAATYNGAFALRLQARKGSLEPGKDADIGIFDASDYRELAYWFGVSRCCETLLRGIRRSTLATKQRHVAVPNSNS
ncbi:MAG: imidazolonepropionase [Candidatus Korobacteraceae bacterium]|jgi:imidazolonepropionase